jgi:hypothetical protein
MLHGVRSEFSRLLTFLNLVALDVADYLQKHVDFDTQRHAIRYTGGPFMIGLRREKQRLAWSLYPVSQ